MLVMMSAVSPYFSEEFSQIELKSNEQKTTVGNTSTAIAETYGWGNFSISGFEMPSQPMILYSNSTKFILGKIPSNFILPNGNQLTGYNTYDGCIMSFNITTSQFMNMIIIPGVNTLEEAVVTSDGGITIFGKTDDFTTTITDYQGNHVGSLQIPNNPSVSPTVKEYILSFDSNLGYKFGKSMLNYERSGSKLTTNQNGDIFILGDFYNTVYFNNQNSVNNFNSGAGRCNNNGNDLFVRQITPNGAWGWESTTSGTSRIGAILDFMYTDYGLYIAINLGACSSDTDRVEYFETNTGNGQGTAIFSKTQQCITTQTQNGYNVNCDYDTLVLSINSTTGIWENIESSENFNFANIIFQNSHSSPIIVGQISNDAAGGGIWNITMPSTGSGIGVVMMKLNHTTQLVDNFMSLTQQTTGSYAELKGLFATNDSGTVLVVQTRSNLNIGSNPYSFPGADILLFVCFGENFTVNWYSYVNYQVSGNDLIKMHFVNNISVEVWTENSAANFGPLNVYAGSPTLFTILLGPDYDEDSLANSYDDDDDDDGILDIFDNCQTGEQFISALQNDMDTDGCRDNSEDLDDDGDGLNDLFDSCPDGVMYWNRTIFTDYDNDGCFDPSEDFDDDNDLVEDFEDMCPRISGNSTYPGEKGCPDDDGDGRANLTDPFPNNAGEWKDTDQDGFGDNSDEYPFDATQNADSDGDSYGDNTNGNNGDDCPLTSGNSTNDRLGCPDSDGDGYSNIADAFDFDETQYLDSDGDGYGNNQSSGANQPDAFPSDGTQWNDTDGDGHGDNPYGTQGDWFPDDPNRWQDSDRDGYADEDDSFPNDITQWNDTDGDGYGDNQDGNNGDAFPDDSQEWKDSDEDGVGNNADQYPYDPTQTVDSDGDGYGDNTNGTRGDVFPQDGSEWSDIDNDGYGDNSDLFPSDGTQWNDTDGDGYGDNINGANGDACPLIAGNSSIILLGCIDTDGDGYADQIDAFISDALSWSDVDGDSIPDELDAYPNDATQSLDSDGDGFGDNPLGTNADKFPNDATQWNDIDGDGYGDNLDGDNPDLFITDGTQWADSDGDGYGDNPQGRLYDMFPDNPTQWQDEDGDGLGDNQSGTDADPFLNDFDNDGFNDAIDILPKLSSPGDLDADGCLDEVDAFPENPQECVDTDNDGVGDNADSDDDGDGWTDADEIRLNADPLSASDQPVDSFEIVVPGTSIGLSAWDLIGIFGGIPLFAWIAFGFATRNGRCDKYEELLRQATSRDELEQVALRWEYSLMLRMLGPHQGIRLERLRSELDDKFEFGENTETRDIGVNQTYLVERESKQLPPIEAQSETQPKPSKDTPATSTDNDGYEWLKTDDGIDWYRAAGSGDQWAKFES